MTFGNRIAALRKERGMTQEMLANNLGVTNQAVSKWENDQSYPDIEQLPNLADLFGVSIDSLFGREQKALTVVEQSAYTPVEGLPWADDSKLRMVAYQGHRLLTQLDAVKDMTVTFEGDAVDIECCFNLNCEDVEGDVTAGGSVNCGDVEGNVEAGGSVNCGDVEGSVEAGGSVNCGDVEGSVEAGGSVTCGDVGGNMTYGNAEGNISAFGSSFGSTFR